LAASQSRVADALGAEGFVVSGNDDADSRSSVDRIESVGGKVVVVILGIEAGHQPIGLRQRTVPIPAKTVGDREIRSDLEIVLSIESELFGTEVAVGFPVENQAVALVRAQQTGEEIRERAEGEFGDVVLAVLDIQL